MLPADHDLAEGVRLAVEDLTARVSDLEGETEGLADERWDDFVRQLITAPSVGEGLQLGRRLIGYRELSFLLVVELAEARRVCPGTIMETYGLWAMTLGE